MRAFVAFFKKEIYESLRSGKLLILLCLFVAFGVMNPAIAKLTPYLFRMLSEELAESGMVITEVTVDALTSWTQFFKNIPMALIAFVLLYSGIFTGEYAAETLVLMLTKGLARYKVVLAKSLLLFMLWSAGYWLCFGDTYGYNAYYWDNGTVSGLVPASVNWWLCGVLVLSLTVLFSTLLRHYGGVLLLTGGSVFIMYLLGLVPKLEAYMPTSLMNSAELLVGAATWGDFAESLAVTAVCCTVCWLISVPIFNRKQL